MFNRVIFTIDRSHILRLMLYCHVLLHQDFDYQQVASLLEFLLLAFMSKCV